MVDFKKVKDMKRTGKPGNPFGKPSQDETFELLIPEGAESGKIPASDQYIGKLLDVTKEVSKRSQNPMWVWRFEIVKGKYKGMEFPIWTTLTNNALWKIADTLTALGIAWEPGTPITFKLKDVLGTLVRLQIVDARDESDSRDVSKLSGVLPHPEGAGKKARGKASAFTPPKDEAEDEEDDELDDEPEGVDEDEELEDAEDDEDAEEEEDEEEEEDASKPSEDDEDDEEDAEDDEEEDDDDEMPLLAAAKKKGSLAPPKKTAKGRKTPAPTPAPAKKGKKRSRL